MEITPGLFVLVAAVALLCEYMDSSIGMGYGTSLTPILLLVGFGPLDVVPAVLLGQLVGGIVGGYWHHRLGNIHLDFAPEKGPAGGKRRWLMYLPRSLDAKVVYVLAGCGIVGGIVGAVAAVNVPTIVLKVYIGAMVLVLGVAILIRRNHSSAFSFKKLLAVGLVSAFNKGISGGGYGPLVTAGQMLSGREVKSSIGSTAVAEVFVCIAAFASFMILMESMYLPLILATAVGSVLAGPFAALTVKRVQSRKLKPAVGLVVALFGGFTLVRAFL